MHSSARFLPFLLAAACGPPPTALPSPGAPAKEAPFEAQTATAQHLTLPARVEPAYRFGYAVLRESSDGGLRGAHDVTFALGEDFPSEPTLTFPQVLVLRGTALLALPRWEWLEVEGDALSAELLPSGEVQAKLLREGSARLQLFGTGRLKDEPAVEDLADLRLTVSVSVRRVAGYRLHSFSARLGACASPLVFAAGKVFRPQASPRDALGREFVAANAPAPVALDVSSTGPMSVTPGDDSLDVGEGHVEVRAQTTLPIDGLAQFDVAGAAALVQATVLPYLVRTASKGTVAERISVGARYPRFFPEQRNVVELRVSEARTALGPLCGLVPAVWFTPTSATPSVCEPVAGGAVLRAPGECRLSLHGPGVAEGWAMHFWVD